LGREAPRALAGRSSSDAGRRSSGEDLEVQEEALAALARVDGKIKRRLLSRRGLPDETAEADPVAYRDDGPAEAVMEPFVVVEEGRVELVGDELAALLHFLAAVDLEPHAPDAAGDVSIRHLGHQEIEILEDQEEFELFVHVGYFRTLPRKTSTRSS